MQEEIERKFMIHTPANLQKLWNELVYAETATRIKQGYMSVEQPTTRVRVTHGQPGAAFLTVKGKRNKKTGGKPEFEYEIPVADGVAMLRLCGDRLITKTRYTLPLCGALSREGHRKDYAEIDILSATMEIDVFSGFLKGLVYVEIEKPSDMKQEVWEKLPLPSWLEGEVTNLKGYSNKALALSQKIPSIPPALSQFGKVEEPI